MHVSGLLSNTFYLQELVLAEMEIVLRAFLRVIKELEKSVIPECAGAGGVSAARGSTTFSSASTVSM